MSDAHRKNEKGRRILKEGVTCWRIASAARIAVLIDGAAYYMALLQALRQARSRVIVLGWDFDPRVRLAPTDPASELRRLLPALVERSPELHVHLLIWDVSVVFGPSSPVNQLFDHTWQAHPRIDFRFDGQHPFAAAHHEQLVCIDDRLAFAGGIDLTVKRGDTPAHDPADPTRVDADGEAYDPVHDLQMAVGGEAARVLANLARGRWAEATGETLPPVRGTNDPWPDSVAPWLRNVPVGMRAPARP